MPTRSGRGGEAAQTQASAAAAALVEGASHPDATAATATAAGQGQPHMLQPGQYVAYPKFDGSGGAAPNTVPEHDHAGWPHDQWVAAQGIAGLKEGTPVQPQMLFRGNGGGGGAPTLPSATAGGPGLGPGPHPVYTVSMTPSGMPGLPQMGWGVTSPTSPDANLQVQSGLASAAPTQKKASGRAGKAKGSSQKGQAGTPNFNLKLGGDPSMKRESPADLSVEIPLSCQGSGELGWHPDLLSMTTIHLNDYVTKNWLEPAQVKALKALRRRIKNRSYTQLARSKSRGSDSGLVRSPVPARLQMATGALIDRSMQCEPSLRDQATQTDKA